jgi:hypothetical protein
MAFSPAKIVLERTTSIGFSRKISSDDLTLHSNAFEDDGSKR